MANRKLYNKPKRVSAVVDDRVAQRLQKKADAKGVSLSLYISKVLTAWAVK